ncbi:alpha/beta hydrolase family esterase [Actinomadura parmotrematis]|uniref:Polyhydroxybutyrate depolymerase n=1 Tax=Actinomadura parmotrematis TaxID=2864039 RepID=A0ABS7FRW9_9ACTN|nr:PHB depolymerase family esterase [Actinomadura parmotrematis]MBW8483106.1 hypothetical protein [Actinomadura parmotrematis]
MRNVIHAMAAALLLAALACLGGPAGAAAATAPEPGTHTRSVTMPGGWKREFLLHAPTARSAKPRPLVVALHGGLDNMQSMERTTGWDDVADAHGFLVAYPNGFLGTWNAGGCCVFARAAGIDDVGFLDKMIGSLVRSGAADPRRVYVTGFSNGGGMAYRYACERAGRVAAIGVVSGSLAVPCEPARPVSLLAFHGTADQTVPFLGGGDQDWDNHTPFLPVTAVLDIWRTLDRLPPLDRIVTDTVAAKCTATSARPVGLQVQLCTIFGGGHEWPRGKGVEATPQLWDFFRHRHV